MYIVHCIHYSVQSRLIYTIYQGIEGLGTVYIIKCSMNRMYMYTVQCTLYTWYTDTGLSLYINMCMIMFVFI